MAAAEDSDDDCEHFLDDANMTNLETEQAKKIIRALLNEQERQKAYQKRLKKKLSKLSADLAEKREIVEGNQRSLEIERNKQNEELKCAQKERQMKAAQQAERVRDNLTEVLYARPWATGSARKGPFELETVLVSFQRKGETTRYKLTFRVDSGTMVKQLRDSACKYWNVAHNDYVLKTMANSKCQNTIKVRDCFKQGEIAQLRLEQRNLDNTTVTEEEYKAIQPKDPKKRKAGDAMDGVAQDDKQLNAIQQFSGGYQSDLKKFGGIYFLLKLREPKTPDYLSKIKLRDIVIYLALAVLTCWVYLARRPTGEAYWCMRGIEEAFLKPMPLPEPGAHEYRTEVPPFHEVSHIDELWLWLNNTVPSIIWGGDANHSLRAFNLFVGHMSIRVQNLKTPEERTEFCSDSQLKAVENLPQAFCQRMYIDQETERTDDFVTLQRYWDYELSVEDGGSTIRGPTKPYKWASMNENFMNKNILPSVGELAYHGPQGYSVDYRMVVPEPHLHIPKYRRDLTEFRRTSWISDNSRFVSVSFTTYNFEYDMWNACDFFFEIAAASSVHSYYQIRSFRPQYLETRTELLSMYMDFVRLAIALYILFFVGFLERKHKVKNGKGAIKYHTSLNGIMDFGIVICIFIIFIWGRVGFGADYTEEYIKRIADDDNVNGFTSSTQKAIAYENIFMLEGLLFVFTMYRLLSFLRIFDMIYVLWHTLGDAFCTFGYFALIFAPVLLGFVFFAHSVWGASATEYSTLVKSILQVYKFIMGQHDVDQMMEHDQVWTPVLIFLLFISVHFILLNVFATIVVDAYYVVRLTYPVRNQPWNFEQRIQWTFPGLCLAMYQAMLSRGQAESS